MKRKKLRLTPKQAEHMLFNVLEIGSRMLVSGAEVQRVENSIYRMCTAYGSETTEVFCMTYMIVVTISSKQFGTITLSRRIHNLSLNLYELLYLNAFIQKDVFHSSGYENGRSKNRRSSAAKVWSNTLHAHICFDLLFFHNIFWRQPS